MRIEESLRVSLLFDFYSPLLTEKQRLVLSGFVYQNISISELAILYNSSRQAINDLIKRTIAILEEYEEKLKLLKKFDELRGKIEKSIALLSSNASKDLVVQVLNEALEVM